MRHVCLRFLLAAAAFSLVLWADDPVFKSDVAMTRVDAQVLDSSGRAITGLEVGDFVLRVNGKPVPIRNFASENMPIDILLLLDISGSMEPHVERIASAAQQALNVLAAQDRVAIMVFDTSTRVRLPFKSSHGEVTNELDRLIRSERFNGGTRITSALLSAARYVGKEARPGARRAIVVLTDDETQDEEDEASVERALAQANAVLSFLQAPYEPPNVNAGGMGRRRGTWGNGGGIGFPGGGGGIGFPGGGGGWPGGRRGGGMGGPGGYGGERSHTAGTETIALDTGGDTMRVDDASALEETLARLRQRYALHFYLPEGVSGTDRQAVRVDLSQEARLRYSDAEVRSRRVYMSGGASERSGPTVVSRQTPGRETTASMSDDTQVQAADESGPTPKRKRAAVNEDSGDHINTIPDDSTGDSQPAKSATPAPAPGAAKGGWPRSNSQENTTRPSPNQFVAGGR